MARFWLAQITGETVSKVLKLRTRRVCEDRFLSVYTARWRHNAWTKVKKEDGCRGLRMAVQMRM